MSSPDNYALPTTENVGPYITASSLNNNNIVQGSPTTPGSQIGLWIGIAIAVLVIIAIIIGVILFIRSRNAQKTQVLTSQYLTPPYVGPRPIGRTV